jgi:opacity protein-like surface antigen
MDWLRHSCCIAMLTALAAAMLLVPAQAQVAPSAYLRPYSLWVGGEYSNVRASFPYQSSQRLTGAGVFADLNRNGRLGMEADARFLHFGGYQGSTESTYLAGPKVFFFAKGRFQPYAKLLVGAGQIHYPYQIGDASYFTLAPGGGSGYRMSRRWTIRAEYEYQVWHNSPGYANEPNHELTPNGFHIGVAYQVFR